MAKRDDIGSRRALLAGLATALAGFFDAAGLAHLGDLYVSFMSGNSTRLGMALSSGEWQVAWRASLIIAAFVIGAGLGTLVADRASQPLSRLLWLECLLCVIAAALSVVGQPLAALVLAALMMGMQNVAHQTVDGIDAGRSYVTGALFGLGQALARALSGRQGLASAGVQALSWSALVAGVLLGGFGYSHLGLSACLAIGAAIIFLLGALARDLECLTRA